MVHPKTAIGSVKNAILQDSTYLTEVDDVVLKRLDLEKEDTSLSQPFIAIHPISRIRSSPHDTERVGYVEDNDGNRIGERFRATFEVGLQIDIHAARGNADLDMDNLGWELEQLLRQYDSRNEDKPLPDDDGTAVDDVNDFRAGEGERNDDLSMSPGLARWTHESMLEFYDEVEATDHVDTISVVHSPSDGDFTGGTGNVAIEYEY